MDYSDFHRDFERAKRTAFTKLGLARRAAQRSNNQGKMVKLRSHPDEQEYARKKAQIAQFLRDGRKVKVSVLFRVRDLDQRDIGYASMQRLGAELKEFGQIAGSSIMVGREIIAEFVPKQPE